MPNVSEALEFMKSNDIKWVDLHFPGINGELQHKTIPAKNLNESTFEEGVQINLEEHYGFAASSLFLFPDSDTYARIPWEISSMRMIAGLYSMPQKERFMKDSRYCIDRLAINSKAMGIGEVKITSDCEFYLLDNAVGDSTVPERGSSMAVDSREAFWNPSPFFNTKNGAYIGQPQDTLYSVRTQISELMDDQFNYRISSHSHGRSASGQQRIVLAESNAKTAADALFTLKYATRSAGMVGSTMATFMPLPLANEKGNSLKLTMRLIKSSENIFYEKGGEYANLSQSALYFIGGLLEHADALSAFCAPTTNSYKKLRIDPRYSSWGKSPNSVVQVSSVSNPFDCALTYTGADSSVNPYIAYAAVAAAGLDGIKNKTNPAKALDEDLSSITSSRAKELKIKSIPSSLIDSISALESDNKFLKGFMASELLESYLEQRVNEYKENEKRPTSYEFEKYFNR